MTDDGLLDVCVVGGEYSAGEAMRLSRKGTHVSQPGVVYARGRQVRIERTDGARMWFEHDGEVLTDPLDSITLDVVPGAVPMLVGDVPAVS
jgi:diacylglycerol kinase (ATP)